MVLKGKFTRIVPSELARVFTVSPDCGVTSPIRGGTHLPLRVRTAYWKALGHPNLHLHWNVSRGVHKNMTSNQQSEQTNKQTHGMLVRTMERDMGVGG